MALLKEIWDQPNWFAIHTKPHKEESATAGVAKLGLECFLPKAKQQQGVCGISRWIIKPVFTGYFFAEFTPKLALDLVRFTPGVLRVVGTSHFPIPIDAGIISELRELRPGGGGRHFRLNPDPTFEPGCRLLVERGPFQGFWGKVEGACNDEGRVAILLEALDHARLLIEKRFVTAAQSVS